MDEPASRRRALSPQARRHHPQTRQAAQHPRPTEVRQQQLQKQGIWWSLRGKLDVPKERWITYPGTERTEDPSPIIAWSGWDHTPKALALAE